MKKTEGWCRNMKWKIKIDPGTLLREGLRFVSAVAGAAAVFGTQLKQELKKAGKKKKGEFTMKKSTVVALLVFLSAVAGALAAGYCYLLKREKELDEYEQMLFSEEYEEDDLPAAEDAEAPKAEEDEEV